VAKNEQEEALERALSASLSRIIDQLKFAEAKNGALIGFATAWTVAIANLMTKTEGPPEGYGNVLPFAGGLFILAGTISLISFLPRWDLSRFHHPDERQDRDPNLLFYGDVAKQPMNTIKDLLETRYTPAKGASATAGYLTDLAAQIHVNSQIACRKFAIFTWATRIVLVAMLVVAFPAVVALSHFITCWLRSSQWL
jgi:hypothetical protein